MVWAASSTTSELSGVAKVRLAAVVRSAYLPPAPGPPQAPRAQGARLRGRPATRRARDRHTPRSGLTAGHQIGCRHRAVPPDRSRVPRGVPSPWQFRSSVRTSALPSRWSGLAALQHWHSRRSLPRPDGSSLHKLSSGGPLALAEDERADQLVRERLAARVPQRPEVAEVAGQRVQEVDDRAQDDHAGPQGPPVGLAEQADAHRLLAPGLAGPAQGAELVPQRQADREELEEDAEDHEDRDVRPGAAVGGTLEHDRARQVEQRDDERVDQGGGDPAAPAGERVPLVVAGPVGIGPGVATDLDMAGGPVGDRHTETRGRLEAGVGRPQPHDRFGARTSWTPFQRHPPPSLAVTALPSITGSRPARQSAALRRLEGSRRPPAAYQTASRSVPRQPGGRLVAARRTLGSHWSAAQRPQGVDHLRPGELLDRK